jgi:hypothetical protein
VLACQRESEADVMIFETFSPKKFGDKLALFTKTAASFGKNLIITTVCEKSAKFYAEKWQKSQKIVIITSTQGF